MAKTAETAEKEMWKQSAKEMLESIEGIIGSLEICNTRKQAVRYHRLLCIFTRYVQNAVASILSQTIARTAERI